VRLKSTELTRRGFIARTSVGVGMAAAGAAGAVATIPQLWAAVSTATSDADLSWDRPAETLIVHVRDVRRGEVALMAGTREVVYRDPQLVATLLRAAHQAPVEVR
jgi:hypothetical protein